MLVFRERLFGMFFINPASESVCHIRICLYKGNTMARKIRVLMTKLGLDIHWRGAVTVAQFLREAGMEVIYLGNQFPGADRPGRPSGRRGCGGPEHFVRQSPRPGPQGRQAAPGKGAGSDQGIFGGNYPGKGLPLLLEQGIKKFMALIRP